MYDQTLLACLNSTNTIVLGIFGWSSLNIALWFKWQYAHLGISRICGSSYDIACPFGTLQIRGLSVLVGHLAWAQLSL